MTKVVNCCRTGAGIRVAVLDTGFDIEHPDFAGRRSPRSFVTGQDVQDGHGHGTHCIGTALGPKCPGDRGRATGSPTTAEIYAGKVLSNAGSGSDTGILAGIEWAIRASAPSSRCRSARPSAGPAVLAGVRARRAARAGRRAR